MLTFVLSPPSPTATWILPLVKQIILSLNGPFNYCHLSTVEELREELVKGKGNHLLFFFDRPDLEIARVLKKSGAPTILIQEDPIRSALHLESSLGQDLATAVRNTSCIFAALHEVVMNTNNLLAVSQEDKTAIGPFLRKIADFLELEMPEEKLEALVRFAQELPAAEPQTNVIARQFFQHSSMGACATPFLAALGPYRSLSRFSPADSFDWHPSLFLLAEPMGAPLQGDIELVGPARPIIYGPYLHLPAGEWEAQVQFEVTANFSGNILYIEVLAGVAVLSSWRTPLPKAGMFGCALPFTNIQPLDPLQIRISILEGAIEGVFALRNVAVRRTPGGLINSVQQLEGD